MVLIDFIEKRDNKFIIGEAAKKGDCRQGRSIHQAWEVNVMHTDDHGDASAIEEFIMTHG